VTTTRFTPIPDARPDEGPWPAMAWPPAPGTVLTGNTVQLTPIDLEKDIEPLFTALDHDPVWAHVIGRPTDPGHFTEVFHQRIADGFFPWVLRLVRPVGGAAAGDVVGSSSYLEVRPSHATLEIGGTQYAPEVWASAVNPEAKLLLFGHAFDTLGAGRVQLKCDARNVRSQQAIARLGARYEGTLRRHAVRQDGTIRDSVVFSVIAEEWPEVREGLRARLTPAS
jgi:RimJ/RimL family protein N-acetyltransferase